MSSTPQAPEVLNPRHCSNCIEQFIEETPDAFFCHDQTGNLLQVNELTCKLLGYTKQEMLKLNVRDIQSGIEPEQAAELWTIVASGRTIVAEDLLKRKDGTTFNAEIRISFFKGSKTPQICGFFNDITERKLKEKRREALITDLEEQLKNTKSSQNRGLTSICSHCKATRDGQAWEPVEKFILKHTNAQLTHGVCPICYERVMKELDASDLPENT